ncbi:hypothetical protein V2J09_014413 [Rumex salicifolius]
MELDVQMFLQNPEQLQFEFPHFPSSYMRLAAHRVAHHYGLQTVVVDNGADALGKIVAMKTPESKYASVCLSEIPAKQPDTGKMEQKKIAIRRRPSRTSSGEADDLGAKHSPARTVEERKEQYDKARARIFNNPGSPTSDDTSPQVFEEDKNFSTNKDDGVCQSSLSVTDADITPGFRDFGSSSRVAIFKDREKDLTDPDYDHSYDRYIKSFPVNQRPFVPFNTPSFQPPMVQYNPGFPQMGGQMPRPQSSIVERCQKVVAGKLYHLTLVAVDGGMKKIYEAKIWVKPWMNFKQLQEFKTASNVSPFSTADLGLMRSKNLTLKTSL